MIDGIVLNSGCAENKTCISSKTYAKKNLPKRIKQKEGNGVSSNAIS